MFYAKCLGLIVFLSIFGLKCRENETKMNIRARQKTKTDADSASIRLRPLPAKVQELISQFSYCRDTQWPENDSSDTRWFDLSAGPETFYLVEDGHYCGQGSGSCGNRIMVIRETDSGLPELIFDDCGSVSEVLRTVHNGMLDFKIQYRTFYREEPVFFRWDGKKVVEFADPKPQNDTDAVLEILTRFYKNEYFSRASLEFDYIDPGNASGTFVLAKNFSATYLLRSRRPGKFEVLNRFEYAYFTGLMESRTNGLCDLQTEQPLISGDPIRWTWDGQKYIPARR